MNMNIDIDPDLNEFLQNVSDVTGFSGETAKITPLFGDGSDRRFFRICCGPTSLIALLSPRTKDNATDENDSYFLIGQHLYSHRLPVPRIYFGDPGNGRFLLEDFGDVHLQRFALSHRVNLERIYSRAVKMLASIHRRVPEGFLSDFCFDSALYDPPFVYERELEYFRRAFLNGYLGLETTNEDLRPDFEFLADAAGTISANFVFHRDFQSRNIMVFRGALRLLDFQGMRFGPPEYDLASLLIDPYVQLASGLQDKLIGMYWAAAGKFLGCTRGEFLKKFNSVRLCRNLQMLGAFGFLGIIKGKKHFLKYIPPAWAQLTQQLRENSRGMFPRLERMVANVSSKWEPGNKSR